MDETSAWDKVGELEKRPFVGGTSAPEEGELRIDFDKKAYAEMIAHGAQSPEVELCGVLVGQVYRDKLGPWVAVSHVIQGARAAEQGAQVTFTHETWEHITAEMDQKHAGRRIVGWYHTHPDFGIFLSEMDTFIHKNFFTEPFHIAWVYDPLSGKEGAFHLHGDAFRSATRYWLGARPRRVAGAAPTHAVGNAEGSSGDVAAAIGALQATVVALQRSLGAPTPPPTSMVGWTLLALVGGIFLLQMRGMSTGDRSAVMVVSEDPRTGMQYGVRVVPLAREPGGIAPLYRDGAGGGYYGVELTPTDANVVEALKRLVLPPARPDAPDVAERAPEERGARQGPSTPKILAVLGGVIALAMSLVLVVTRRQK
jgi:proteasome lid subunit RPN8/RPN11